MKERPKLKFDLDEIFIDNGVASANECTGLMSIPPENDWENEAYRDIYNITNRGDNKMASESKK